MSSAMPHSISPAEAFAVLTQWYKENARPLPWREAETSPWGIIVCEVMSQQTPVSRVAPIWEEWMKRWPTPASFSRISPAEVLLAWGKLGYPQRALRLLECAHVICERHQGIVPAVREDLLALPGIGPYTADAVLAFAFQKRSTVLDTNIRRVLARWHGTALPAPHQTKAEAERAHTFVPHTGAAAAQWNEAIMEFGALVCTSKKPVCNKCPCTDYCQWQKAGYPADTYSATRKPQQYEGTQREARGKILDILRNRHPALPSLKQHCDDTSQESSRKNARYLRSQGKDVSPISVTKKELLAASGLNSDRFFPAFEALIADGLIEQKGENISLPQSTRKNTKRSLHQLSGSTIR